jgi:large subunit ribosomal protein L32
MSVPKKRRTSSSAGRRRSHHALKQVTLIKCSKCGNAIEPHRACSFCGTYRDREIIKIKEKTTKSAK